MNRSLRFLALISVLLVSCMAAVEEPVFDVGGTPTAPEIEIQK